MVPTSTAVIVAANSARIEQENQQQANALVQASEQDCKFQVKINAGEFQCMTQEEYTIYKNLPLSTEDYIFSIGIISLLIILVIFVVKEIFTN